MRVLRSTCWASPHRPPSSFAIVREQDIAYPIDELNANTKVFSGFVANDLFEMPDADLDTATFEAQRRLSDEVIERERNQAVLYYYLLDTFPRMKDGGMIGGDRNVPLCAEDMLEVFRQLTTHPDYRRFVFIYPDQHGQFVTYPEAPR